MATGFRIALSPEQRAELHRRARARAVAAQRVGRRDDRALGEERRELDPARLQQADWQDRHAPSATEGTATSTVAGAPACALLPLSHAPIVGRS